MKKLRCPECEERLPQDAFRKTQEVCVWCQWQCAFRRATARYKDKAKADAAAQRRNPAQPGKRATRLNVTEQAFVDWYLAQPDRCHYCRITMAEVKQLRLKRGGFGYFVSWDIDRKDAERPYELGNMALSCFVCNMAKGKLLTENEALLVGRSVRRVFRRRLAAANAA